MNCRKIVRKIKLGCYLSTTQLATLLGLTRAAVNYYETGRSSPKIETVEKLQILAKSAGLEFKTDDYFKKG